MGGDSLTFQRSWVQIPAPDTGWTWHIFTLICCKICIVCLKGRKLTKKRASLAHIFFKKNYYQIHWTPETKVKVFNGLNKKLESTSAKIRCQKSGAKAVSWIFKTFLGNFFWLELDEFWHKNKSVNWCNVIHSFRSSELISVLPPKKSRMETHVEKLFSFLKRAKPGADDINKC